MLVKVCFAEVLVMPLDVVLVDDEEPRGTFILFKSAPDCLNNSKTSFV